MTNESGPSVRRFHLTFLDRDKRGTKASTVLPPGERRIYAFTAPILFAPETLTIVAASRRSDDRLSSCPIRLREIHIADHVVDFGDGAFGPTIDLKPRRLRELNVAETMYCVVENTSKEHVIVKVTYSGRPDGQGDRLYHMGASPTHAESRTRRVTVPAVEAGDRTFDLSWKSLWPCRVKRFWIHSDSHCDLDLVDVKVGNRGQLLSIHPMPAEMYENGVDVNFDGLVTAQDLSFAMLSTSKEERHVEVEIEAEIDDPGVSRTEDGMLGGPRDMREYPLGFYEETVLPGQHCDLVSIPAIPFRGERMLIPSSLNFEVISLRVLGRDYLNLHGPMPSINFAENHLPGPKLSLPIAPPGTEMVLRVRNTGKEPSRFMAALIGTAGHAPEDALTTISPEAHARALELIQSTPQFLGLARQFTHQLAHPAASR
jgi:hypothetical protein